VAPGAYRRKLQLPAFAQSSQGANDAAMIDRA
jgi:hypothetical protein